MNYSPVPSIPGYSHQAPGGSKVHVTGKRRVSPHLSANISSTDLPVDSLAPLLQLVYSYVVVRQPFFFFVKFFNL